ncbi:MAG TPA: YraN family protein [Nitrospiraceae bacterium]|nr:YraN family protein [Nitrospiraceae bacterium]
MSVAGRLFGQAAESEAERYLRRKGYCILARNARTPSGEMDLVTRSGSVLVFVEVKARGSSTHGGAVAAVDGRKRARLVKLAAQYLARHGLRDQPCRFDVVLCAGGKESPAVLEHIEDAFEVPGDDLRW